jgi:hypothetical protein
MMLEAVWFKNGKEVCKVAPVLNIVCDEDMKSIKDIEIENEFGWCSYTDFEVEADDFVIRIKRG